MVVFINFLLLHKLFSKNLDNILCVTFFLYSRIDEDENESSENKTKRSLHIWEDLSKDILAPKNVLPRKIIEEM